MARVGRHPPAHGLCSQASLQLPVGWQPVAPCGAISGALQGCLCSPLQGCLCSPLARQPAQKKKGSKASRVLACAQTSSSGWGAPGGAVGGGAEKIVTSCQKKLADDVPARHVGIPSGDCGGGASAGVGAAAAATAGAAVAAAAPCCGSDGGGTAPCRRHHREVQTAPPGGAAMGMAQAVGPMGEVLC